MIEEKTKEPQSQAPAAPVKGREKLRSFWAKVQISGLLRRHRFRRKTQRHMNDVAKKLRASAVVLAVGEALYALGFAAEYMVVRTGRGIAAVARGLARWCRNALHTIIATAFPAPSAPATRRSVLFSVIRYSIIARSRSEEHTSELQSH